jgi:hypothetical protein
MGEKTSDDKDNEQDQLEEIKEDNIVAEEKQQSKQSRSRQDSVQTGNSDQKWPAT